LTHPISNAARKNIELSMLTCHGARIAIPNSTIARLGAGCKPPLASTKRCLKA